MFPKLGALCTRMDPLRDGLGRCEVEHRTTYVERLADVVYRMSLPCGRVYVGQTSQCVNHQLLKRAKNVKRRSEGWLAIHCGKRCFSQRVCIALHADELTPEIIEAHVIEMECVSVP